MNKPSFKGIYFKLFVSFLVVIPLCLPDCSSTPSGVQVSRVENTVLYV